jgi:hypothetical protein
LQIIKLLKLKCEHNKEKRDCRECGGSRFCEHDIRKYNCISCGGSGIVNIINKNACKKVLKEMDYEHDKEKHTVKSVKEVVYVNIISKKDNANIVMVVHFVNTENQK